MRVQIPLRSDFVALVSSQKEVEPRAVCPSSILKHVHQEVQDYGLLRHLGQATERAQAFSAYQKAKDRLGRVGIVLLAVDGLGK